MMNIPNCDEVEKENEEAIVVIENLQITQKEEVNTKPKTTKVKRNPFEKIIDDSLKLCEDPSQNNEFEANVDKIIQNMEKEIMKKEEYYLLFQLYEKAKKYKQEYAQIEDTNTNINFGGEIKERLLNIKNCYENKKKTLTKKNNQETENEKIEPNTSKKKKVNNKKENVIIDTSEIVKRIEEANLNDINEKKLEQIGCVTPIKEKIEDEDDILSLSGEKEEGKEAKNIKNDTALKKNSASNNSEKKNKNEKAKDSSSVKLNMNMNITNFFSKKHSTSAINSSQFLSSSNQNLNKSEFKSEDQPENNKINNYLEQVNQFTIDINPLDNDNNFYANEIKTAAEIHKGNGKPDMFIINLNSQNSHLPEIYFNMDYLQFAQKELSESALRYYNLRSKEMKNTSDLKQLARSYFKESSIRNKTQDAEQNKNKRRRRIIFIHDSFMRNRKFTEKTSAIINPRNPFKKDDCLIDYDKDSEEEVLEENAEDIKSNENSADEEEAFNEEEEDEEKWIVPDGHLSEDEVSEKDDLQTEIRNENNKRSVMDIIEFRKGYSKPVVISMRENLINSQLMISKVKTLSETLAARIFTQANSNDVNNKENLLSEFPIQIISKNKIEETCKKGGMNVNLKDRLDDVVREIHMSYMTKEYLIKLINEKFPGISKKSIDTFFKDSCLKIKCKTTLRKQWLVKKEILDTFNFLPSELTKIFETQNNIYEEKEKERKKEVQLNEDNKAIIINEHRLNNNVLNNVSGLNNINIPQNGGFCLMNINPITNSIQPASSNNINLFNINDTDNNKPQSTIESILNPPNSKKIVKNKNKNKEGGESTKKKIKTENAEKKAIKSEKKSLGSSHKKAIHKVNNIPSTENDKKDYFDLTKITMDSFVVKTKKNQNQEDSLNKNE